MIKYIIFFMAWIKFGDYNKNYKYIIFSCIFNYLTLNITTGNLNNILISLYEIFKETENLYYHNNIYDIFNYLGVIIISFILYKIKENKSNTNKPNIENDIEKNPSEIILIYNDIKEEINKDISFLNLFFILSYWIFIDHITKIIESLMIFDYWMFELLIISLITSKLFKINIYTHQIIGITINSLCCLVLGIIRFIILYNKFHETKSNEGIPYFSIKYVWFIPISIIIYLFLVSSTSYIYTKLKFYMDLKFISQIKLLNLYGIIGFVFSSIACLIETLFKCVGKEKEFFCKIYEPYNDNATDSTNITNTFNIANTTNTTNITNTNNSRYIENFYIFFNNFKRFDNVGVKIIEIVIIFFRVLFNFCSIYFDMLVINYLTPMHFMFGSLIYVFLNDLTQLIIPKKDGEEEQPEINLLNFLAYICSFIGFMIYLEIIELNFCKLNYNLRKYISERSIKDIYEDDVNESIISDNDNDNNEGNSTIRNKVELSFNKEK